MTQWGVRRRVVFLKDNQPQLSSTIIKEEVEEDSKDEVLRAVKTEPLETPEPKRRKFLERESKRMQHGSRGRPTVGPRISPTERGDIRGGRWASERYRRAEQSLLDVMKDKDVSFENPITRPVLRMAARPYIGDTGLLDHLLKYIDGRVTPCGSKRFRRWFNRHGIMEYWLESVELANIRKEAGQDPYWFPAAGGPSAPSDSSGELKLLKAEVDKLKSDMQVLLVSKKQEKDQANQNMLEDLVQWKGEIEESLKLTFGSWKGIQDQLGELMIWKATIEQQLVEITNVMTNMQIEKQYTATNLEDSERWEDWLEGGHMDNFQGNEIVPWFESTNPVNAEGEVIIQDPHSPPSDRSKPGDSSSQDPFCTMREGVIEFDRNRDMPKLEWEKQTECQANVTPNSSATASSKSDSDNLESFQDMFKELFSWKSKMEEKLLELTNSVSAIKQASKLYGPSLHMPEDENLSMDYYPCFKF